MQAVDVREKQTSDSDAAGLLDRILEGLPFGAAVIDRELKIRFRNTQAAKMLELDPSLVAPGAPVAKVIETLVARNGNDDGAEASTAVAHILTQISVDGSKFTQKTPSGRVIALTFRPIDGERIVTVEDVTDEDAERETLKQSAA